jgi:hypothetical protein
MKIPSVLQNLLTNKIVLNIVCVLSALNMIGYLVTGEITAILFFIVLAIIITQFNKNMIVVLGVPLILVNLFVAKGFNYLEGFEAGDKTDDTTTKPDTTGKPAISPPQKAALDNAVKNKGKTGGAMDMSTMVDTPNTSTSQDSFEVGRAKRRGAGPQIDYASTVEDAYDNLTSILGSDGIKNLTSDTKRLMEQQQQLAESMKSMGPMVASLEPMMKQAEAMMSGMSDNGQMGNVMEMMQKMGMGKKQ